MVLRIGTIEAALRAAHCCLSANESGMESELRSEMTLSGGVGLIGVIAMKQGDDVTVAVQCCAGQCK